jgi:hypothetical protein
MVTVNQEVVNDFEIRCFRYSTVPEQVGDPVCLHTAFLKDDLFVRVPLTQELQLDLIFMPAPQEDKTGSCESLNPLWQALHSKLDRRDE